MKRTIISLILNIILFVLWSIVGIGKAVAEPSWMCLVYGGLMTIYLVTVIDEARHVAKLVRTGKALKENKNEKVIL